MIRAPTYLNVLQLLLAFLPAYCHMVNSTLLFDHFANDTFILLSYTLLLCKAPTALLPFKFVQFSFVCSLSLQSLLGSSKKIKG